MSVQCRIIPYFVILARGNQRRTPRRPSHALGMLPFCGMLQRGPLTAALVVALSVVLCSCKRVEEPLGEPPALSSARPSAPVPIAPPPPLRAPTQLLTLAELGVPSSAVRGRSSDRAVDEQRGLSARARQRASITLARLGFRRDDHPQELRLLVARRDLERVSPRGRRQNQAGRAGRAATTHRGRHRRRRARVSHALRGRSLRDPAARKRAFENAVCVRGLDRCADDDR